MRSHRRSWMTESQSLQSKETRKKTYVEVNHQHPVCWRPSTLDICRQSGESIVDEIRHYNDVIMSTMASQITSLTIVYSIVYSGPDQRKHQSNVSLAFVRGIHWWLVNSPHKWPVTWKTFPFDDVTMNMAELNPQNIRSQWCQVKHWYQRLLTTWWKLWW